MTRPGNFRPEESANCLSRYIIAGTLLLSDPEAPISFFFGLTGQNPDDGFFITIFSHSLLYIVAIGLVLIQNRILNGDAPQPEFEPIERTPAAYANIVIEPFNASPGSTRFTSAVL